MKKSLFLTALGTRVRTGRSLFPRGLSKGYEWGPHAAHLLCPQQTPRQANSAHRCPRHLLPQSPSKAGFKFSILGLPRVPCQKAVAWTELLLTTACSPPLSIPGSAPHQRGRQSSLGLVPLRVLLTVPSLRGPDCSFHGSRRGLFVR